MTIQRIQRILKRFPYIKKMLAEGKTEARFYIGKRTEHIIVDEKVKITLEILRDVENSLKEDWEREMVEAMKAGKSDVQILREVPACREKYYKVKWKLIDKIYKCCIHRGLVTYEQVLSEDIG